MTAISVAPAGQRAVVRPLVESDLDAADAVLRSAFNTFVGVPDLFGDVDYVHTRFRAAPDAALAAEIDGEVVGSNFLTRWGSFGFFGPLSVRPDLWDQGIARRRNATEEPGRVQSAGRLRHRRLALGLSRPGLVGVKAPRR